MLIDVAGHLDLGPLTVEAAAVQAEEEGYDGFAAPETKHDVFTLLTLAARATSRVTLQSGIAVAFARNPLSVAHLGNDLQLISAGRFQLGLGSQVQAHIERRFAMTWSHPAARMEEFIAAVRAIWERWAAGSGERLNFRGEFYSHTLMTDFFDPGVNQYGNPPIFLAAVGSRMTEVAGRVADGMLVHPFTTAAYLQDQTVPTLARARGSMDGFTMALSALTVLGETEADRRAAERAVRGQIAFYGSTPAYLPVLAQHGWGDLHTELNKLSRQQAWAQMADLINDDVLDVFAVAGNAAEVAHQLRDRFGHIINRLSLYVPYDADPAELKKVADLLRG